MTAVAASLLFWPHDLTGWLADLAILVVLGCAVPATRWYLAHKQAIIAQVQAEEKRAEQWMEAHLSETVRQQLEAAAQAAVLWAEHFIAGTGKDRFTAVLDILTKDFSKWGIDVATIERAIQAAFALLNANGVLVHSTPAPDPAPTPAPTPAPAPSPTPAPGAGE